MKYFLYLQFILICLPASAQDTDSILPLSAPPIENATENPLLPAKSVKNKSLYSDFSIRKNVTSTQESNFVGTVANTYSSNLLGAAFIVPIRRQIFMELRSLYRQYETVENQNKTFELHDGYDFGVFAHFRMPDNHSTMGIGVGKRRYEYIGIKNTSDTTSADDVNKLSIQRFDMLWSGVNYFQSTEVFGQTGRLKIAATYALRNQHQLSNGQQEENQYVELEMEYRHYLAKSLWLAIEGKFARQQSAFSTINHLGQQVSLGIFF